MKSRCIRDKQQIIYQMERLIQDKEKRIKDFKVEKEQRDF